MNELYAEAGVKRKDTFGTYALRFILIFCSYTFFPFSVTEYYNVNYRNRTDCVNRIHVSKIKYRI
jgi:hypothetical protein